MTHAKTAAAKRAYVKKHVHDLKGEALNKAYRAAEKNCPKYKK